MTRTLAEIDATVRKAIRGHGCPWGMAEEAGKAARWLAAHGMPADRVMADFATAQGACCCGPDARPCGLKQATGLADRACTMCETTTLAAPHPLLVLAQMGRAADALDCTFELEWTAATATVSRNALAIDMRGDLLAPAPDLRCRPSAPVDGTPPSPAACAIDARSWGTLCTLAARILVPASDLSRAGAGAAQSDND